MFVIVFLSTNITEEIGEWGKSGEQYVAKAHCKSKETGSSDGLQDSILLRKCCHHEVCLGDVTNRYTFLMLVLNFGINFEELNVFNLNIKIRKIIDNLGTIIEHSVHLVLLLLKFLLLLNYESTWILN